MEEVILGIILHSGNARTKCLQAFRYFKTGDFTLAEQLLQEAKESINLAHYTQTELIQTEAQGTKTPITLLLVHAQDHLMTTLAIKDMVIEMQEYTKAIDERLTKAGI